MDPEVASIIDFLLRLLPLVAIIVGDRRRLAAEQLAEDQERLSAREFWGMPIHPKTGLRKQWNGSSC